MAWTEAAWAGSAGPDLLVFWLARACVQVLPVAGASISVMDDLRIPVGASDRNAAIAERVQSSGGQGPCLEAHQTRRPIVATERSIRDSWPTFYAELVARTPYRSVVSVPLTIGPARLGALDLYLEGPEDAAVLSLTDATVVADQISAAMNDAPSATTWFGIRQPTWLTRSAAQRRMKVWQATGRISAALSLDAADATALLRAHTYAAGRDIDDVAADVVSGRLPTDALWP
jgi:hypothetical protein